MKLNVYHYQNYKIFLRDYLAALGRGSHSDLAEALRCTKSYLSQVLNQGQHFTVEQAYQFALFAKLDQPAIQYFLLMVQHERAENFGLKKFFFRKLESIHRKKSKTVSLDLVQEFRIKKDFQNEFYSTWRYMAIHTALSIHRLSSPKLISTYLGIPEPEVKRILERLGMMGLAHFQEGRYRRTHQKQAVLDENQLLIEKSHQICMHYLGDALGRAQKAGNLYSAFIPLCFSDAKKISQILSEAKSKINSIAYHSKNPDHVYFLSMGLARASVDE